MNEDEKLLTLQQTIDYLQIGKTTIYRWMDEKRIRALKVGNGIRFYEKDVKALVTVRNEQYCMEPDGIKRDSKAKFD